LVYPKGQKIFKKSRSYFEIPGPKMAKQSILRTNDPQLCNELWASLLSGAFRLVHVNLYTFSYVRGKTALIIRVTHKI
jgi:hypothetical protein